MPQERVSMHKIKTILRLAGLGLSQRQIAASCQIGQATVSEHLRMATQAGLQWPDIADCDKDGSGRRWRQPRLSRRTGARPTSPTKPPCGSSCRNPSTSRCSCLAGVSQPTLKGLLPPASWPFNTPRMSQLNGLRSATRTQCLSSLLKAARPQKYRDNIRTEQVGTHGAPLIPPKIEVVLVPTPTALPPRLEAGPAIQEKKSWEY